MKNKLLLSALLTLSIMPTTKPNNDALKIGTVAACSVLSPMAATGGVYYGFSSLINLLCLQPYPCVRDFFVSALCGKVLGSLREGKSANLNGVSEENKSLAKAVDALGLAAGAGVSGYWVFGGFENKCLTVRPPTDEYTVFSVWPPSMTVISRRS